MAKICISPRCDFSTEHSDYTHCGKCGKELISDCPSCSKEIPETGLKHCVYCGVPYHSKPQITAPMLIERSDPGFSRF